MLDKRMLLALSVLAVLGLAVIPVWLSAAPTVRLPSFRVLANGNQFGTFITLTRSGEPVIALEVAGETNLVPLMFSNIGSVLRISQACDTVVMYDAAGCTGNAFVRTPGVANGTTPACDMLGATYAPGPDPTTGNHSIFKGTGPDANPQPTIVSRAIQGGACSAAGALGTVTAATNIFDIDANFPGPYTLQ